MLLSRPKTNSHLLPLLRYRDVGVASDWLCAVFGFQPHFSAQAPDGSVFYAELRLNESMVMLGSSGQPNPDAVMPPPSEIAVDESLGCYIIVENVDAHYRHAKASGAQSEFALRSDAAGGRGYTCRDLEGHVWNFGTYDPWKLRSTATPSKKRPAKTETRKGLGLGLGLAVVLTMMLSVASGWIVYEHVRGPDNALSQHIRKVLRQAMRAVTPSDAKPESAKTRPQTGRSLSTGTINRGHLPSPAEKRELETIQTLRENLEKARKTVAMLSASRGAEQMAGSQESERQRKEAKAALAAAKKDAEAAQQALKRARQEKVAAEADAQEAAANAQRANALLDKERIAKAAAEEKVLRVQQNAGRRVAALEAQISSQASELEAAKAKARNATAKRASQSATGGGSARTQLKEALVRAEEAEDKVQALQSQVEALKADKSAMRKTVEEAEAELAVAKKEREAAMEALADAGAKIAELQVDLKAAKASAARANARAARARSKPKTTTNPPKNLQWPYSEW